MSRRERPAATGRRGFTLLEAAVALAIIGMVSAGALAAFGAELRAAGKAQELLPAAALAEETLAHLELADPGAFRAGDMLPDSLRHGQYPEPFHSYEWAASAAPVRGEPALYELSVTVTWPDGQYTLARRRYRPLPALGIAGRGLPP